MIKAIIRNQQRQRRHKRIRTKIDGTKSCPRLCVFRSNKNIYAQIINDEKGNTLVATSSLALKLANGSNQESAKAVGEEIAKLAKGKKIKKVVFDRGGYLYHGRVKAFAEAARAAGLQF